jgi:hypothetical protein
MDPLYITNKNEKDNDRNITFPIYRANYKEKAKFSVDIKIENFDTFINGYFSESDTQLLWNEIKEKFGKDVDEKELLKIFKFYLLIFNFIVLLDAARKWVINNVINLWGYDLYNSEDLFDGRLNGRTFQELFIKIWDYREEFAKRYGQDKEQKNEQSKGEQSSGL